MQLQDSARPPGSRYRGADWGRMQAGTGSAGRSSGAAVGGTPSAPARLGSSTHFDTYSTAAREFTGPAYLATLKSYGPNGGKLVLRTVHDTPDTRPPTPSDRPRRNRTGMERIDCDPVTVQKSAWRARSKLEDWIRMECQPGMDYRLVTLTRRNGFAQLDEVWQALAVFRRMVERHYPGVRLCAVPEFHWGDGVNRGTYHVHCVMVFPGGMRPLYGVFHRLWYRALGGTGKESGPSAPGNCDFAKTHHRDGTRYTACQAARYLSKYIAKDLLHGKIGQKRFTTSHGAPAPVKRYWWEPIAASHSMTRARAVSLLRMFFPAETHVILSRTFHDGGDTYHVFSAEPAPS